MRLIDADLFRDELFRQYELVKVDDYEVWAVVDVDEVLYNIGEVKAIPIEFIERKLAEHWYVDYDVRELLADWEKENE